MKKTFDCVEMKRKGALKIYEETKDMTFEQKAEYWRKLSEEAIKSHARRQNRKMTPSAR